MHDMEVDQSVRHLFQYLVENGNMVAIEEVDENQLHKFPQDVLREIQSGDPAWESMVPDAAVKIIKSRGLFGYHNVGQ